jgi:hypothetical protein
VALWLPALLILALLFPPFLFLSGILIFFILTAWRGSLPARRAFAPAFPSSRIPFRGPPLSL